MVQPRPWKRQLQRFSGALLFVLLLVLGYGLSLALEGHLVVTGLRIRDLREQRASLERSMADLQARLATATSYEVMAERARALGYHPAGVNEILYAPVAGYQPVEFVPSPSKSEDRPTALDPAFFPPTYSETWLAALMRSAWWPVRSLGEGRP